MSIQLATQFDLNIRLFIDLRLYKEIINKNINRIISYVSRQRSLAYANSGLSLFLSFYYNYYTQWQIIKMRKGESLNIN